LLPGVADAQIVVYGNEWTRTAGSIPTAMQLYGAATSAAFVLADCGGNVWDGCSATQLIRYGSAYLSLSQWNALTGTTDSVG
jgi:hypothetical protein